MGNNTTGGIILFIVGAVIISMGVSEKGKRIFNILVGGGSGTTAPTEKESIFKDDSEKTPEEIKREKDYLDDTRPKNGNLYGFAGEKGAKNVG